MRWRLLGFARVLFWGDKVEQRFSQHGKWLQIGLVVTMIFGVNIKLSMIYQMFSLLLMLWLVALLLNVGLGLKKRNLFVVSRVLPVFATVNVPFSYQVQLKNLQSHDRFDVRVSERFSTTMPSLQRFLAARDPLEDQRNWYDRKTGFYRFVWLQQWFRGADFDTVVVPKLEAQSTICVDMPVMPIRRGWICFSRLRLGIAEPLGFLYRFEEHQHAQSLLVLPKRYGIGQHLSLLAGRGYQQGGVSQASAVGDAEEFNRLREYRAGDSPRHMHWASLARGGKPLVKEYQNEHFTRQALLLDSFADASQTQAFEEAVSVAAGFAATEGASHSMLDLMFVHQPNEDVGQLTAGQALAHPEQMLQALAGVQLSKQEDFQAFVSGVLRQSESFDSCVLVFLAWDGVRQGFVRELLAQNMLLRVFVVVDEAHSEMVPDLSGIEGRFHVLTVGAVQQGLDIMDT